MIVLKEAEELLPRFCLITSLATLSSLETLSSDKGQER